MQYVTSDSVKGYTIQKKIGAGGFGEVYLATESRPNFEREVALKIISPTFANKPNFIRRFENEAQLVARLEYPYIVPLYDYWRDPDGAYLVMRWLPGGSVKDALADGPLELEAISRILNQVCSALALAHRKGVIHRDIKPGNILLDEEGNAYLSDFGIAKDFITFENITQPEDIIGSPKYISPEQARTEPVSPRTDVYSLGVTLYEMLAGKHPFPKANMYDLIFKHINEPLPELTQLDIGIQDDINKVIQTATAKNPVNRYADAREFAQAFHEAARLEGTLQTDSIEEYLTIREQQILSLVAEGKTNKEIAGELVVALDTVKWHLRNAYKKLGVQRREQAIVKVRNLDLVGSDATSVGKDTSHYLLDFEPENPYKGLEAFTYADAGRFYGRTTLIQKLLVRLQQDHPHQRFLAVLGPSGSGKSSLVRAGLVPALWQGKIDGSDRWLITDMIPRHHPVDELEIALREIAAKHADGLSEVLSHNHRGLVKAAQLILPDEDTQLLLVIDQFEEVFTLVEGEEERVHFLNLVSTAITDPDSRVRVVITIRADFYDRPLYYAPFADVLRDRVETVLPLSAEELQEAITQPAKNVGVKFEEGLVPTIIDDINYQPGALPLLQYALTELFEKRAGRRITREAYAEIGGTVGALARRADQLYAQITAEGQQAVRQMLMRLVTLGEGTADARRRVTRAELLSIAEQPALMDEVIDTFAEHRLLALDHDPATREPTVEVAHEAILQEWERLRNWLNESRGDIKQQRQLATLTAEWETYQRSVDFLVRGARLDQFQTWAADTALALTPNEKAFLDASLADRKRRQAEAQAQAEREAKLEQRARRVLQGLAAVFLVAAVISGVLALLANDQRNEAESQADRAEQQAERAEQAEQEALTQASIGLASQGIIELNSDTPERGVLLALEALEHYPYTPQAERALAEIVNATRTYQSLQGDLTIQATAFSPDGTKLITIGGERDAVLWDLTTGERQFIGSNYGALEERRPHIDVAWSPDGTRFVIVAGEVFGYVTELGSIKIWNAETYELETIWFGHDEQDVWGVDWSKGGSTLVTGGGDGLVRVWDANTTEEIMMFEGHTADVNDVAYSPDDRHIASASADRTVRIWDVESGESLITLEGHLQAVNSVDWSPDGSQVISAGDDGLAIIWDVSSGDLVTTLTGHTAVIRQAAWSPEGTRIATASDDGTARIWDAALGSVLDTMRGTSRGIAWSPDSNKLAIGQGQFSLRIWDVPRRQIQLVGHEQDLIDGRWTPDGSYIITTSWDATARVWDATSGNPVLTFSDHQTGSNNDLAGWVNILPDSQHAVTSGPDGTRIWDIENGEERIVFFDIQHAHAVSPDGSRLALVGTNRGVVLDIESSEILVDFVPQKFEGQWYFTSRMAWSPDGQYFVVPCSGPETYVYDALTGEHVRTLTTESGIWASDWSRDGALIVTAGNDGIYVWDAATGEHQYTFTAHTSTVWDVEYSPNGLLIASGGDSGRVRVWNPITREEVNSYDVGFSILDVAWSPDGTEIITVGTNPVPDIRPVWQTTEELIAHSYECCVTRELTPEERQQFGLPERD